MRVLWVFLLFAVSSNAQQVYWVPFTQKDSTHIISRPQEFLSAKAITRRQKFGIPVGHTDLPVSKPFVDELSARGFRILAKSKWMNGVAVVVPQKKDLDTLNNLWFAAKPVLLGRYYPPRHVKRRVIKPNEFFQMQEARQNPRKKTQDVSWYGRSYNQVSMLQTQYLHQKGLTGGGVDIAVIDAGFSNADTLPVFQKMKNENRVVATYDFVEGHEQVYEDDDHGLAVLSCMAGFLPNEYIGTAPGANYYLLRSEDAHSEMPVEEIYWIAAIEYADSAGVDLVNSSLGYNIFDDFTLNHSAKDLDGKTTLISKAAALAVHKGMVVVVSAGNEGDEEWKFICVPADAPEVITVGGVDANRYFVGFSSIGVSNHRPVKPDVMAQGDNVWVASAYGVLYQGDGTSYASPLMSGSVACLMQAFPGKTPAQLMDVLHLSGSLYYNPDRYFGYGVPDMQLAYQLLKGDTADAILDVKVLQDNRVHIVFCSASEQKVEITIVNEAGAEVLRETVAFKQQETDRRALKKIKQFPKGKYTLLLNGELGNRQYHFNNP